MKQMNCGSSPTTSSNIKGNTSLHVAFEMARTVQSCSLETTVSAAIGTLFPPTLRADTAHLQNLPLD